MGWLLGAVTPDFGYGLLFGATLLVSGIWIGIRLGRQIVVKDDSSTLEAYHLATFLKGLFRWTDGFASDISKYREEVDRIGAHFQAASQEGRGSETASILPLLSQIVAANEDVTNRMTKAEATLQQQAQEITGYMSEARTDALTGLPNRRAFDDELARRFSEWRKNGRPISVVFVDIDHFKKFNDQHGHLAGDAVLTQVARTLRDSMHDSDLVVRIGGEEFAAILPNCKAANAAQAAERARAAIERAPFYYEKKRLRVTISCGASQVIKDELASSLIKRADEAMYASKDAGRNCAHLHNGKTCLPVTKRIAESATRCEPLAPEPSDLAGNVEFRQVCTDLRQRLMAVVEQEA
ncbi:MAG: GGDEF domain-containing protein [Pirellulaceae bacterium]